MKTLLIDSFCSPSSTAGKYSVFLEQMPPIAIAYVAGALDAAGKDVAFYDQIADHGDPVRLEETLAHHRPDIVGLSAVTPTAAAVFQTSRDVRRLAPDATIVMGNIHADLFAPSILKKGLADVVVHGEGEETIVDLVDTLERGGDLADVQGISFLREGEVLKTPTRPFIENLDSLAYPAWHLFPTQSYHIFGFARVTDPGTLINGSRGCPYACTFCSLKVMGHRRRVRSAKSLVDEIEWLHSTFGYKQVSFTDPIFPLTKKEGLEFCDEMIRRGMHEKVCWITEARVDNVDAELLVAMRAAGLRRIMYGFETGDEDVLASIKKDFTLERAHQAVRDSHAAGVEVVGFFMIGSPFDSEEGIKRTIRFAKKIDVDFAKFTVFVPYPGTDDYKMLQREDDWFTEGTAEDDSIWYRFTSYPTAENPPIYVPPQLTAAKLAKLQRHALLSFYTKPKILFRHLFKIRTIRISEMVRGVALSLAP